MLSQDIKTLRVYFSDHRHGGITVSSEDAEHLAGLLKDYEAKARHLEGSKIDPSVKLTHAHLDDDNVILFPIVRRGSDQSSHGGEVS